MPFPLRYGVHQRDDVEVKCILLLAIQHTSMSQHGENCDVLSVVSGVSEITNLTESNRKLKEANLFSIPLFLFVFFCSANILCHPNT